MLIQYLYALLTMLPCPIWFWYRWASAGFLLAVFVWATYNGATYYIDVFGKRMERELEALKKDVQKWQGTPAGAGKPLPDDRSPLMRAESALEDSPAVGAGTHQRSESLDDLPPLDQPAALAKEEAAGGGSVASGVVESDKDGAGGLRRR